MTRRPSRSAPMWSLGTWIGSIQVPASWLLVRSTGDRSAGGDPCDRQSSTLTGSHRPKRPRCWMRWGRSPTSASLEAQRVARKGRPIPRRQDELFSRRLAPHVFVEDLGRITLSIGSRTIEGATIRRKVLALMTFLLTRPRAAAARDEVLEAMWPDFEPSTAQNSLNQTVYFLRRVFEPPFSEDTTAGYVGQDGETVGWTRPRAKSKSAMPRANPDDPCTADPAEVLSPASITVGSPSTSCMRIGVPHFATLCMRRT